MGNFGSLAFTFGAAAWLGQVAAQARRLACAKNKGQ